MSKTCRDLRAFYWGKFSWTEMICVKKIDILQLKIMQMSHSQVIHENMQGALYLIILYFFAIFNLCDAVHPQRV